MTFLCPKHPDIFIIFLEQGVLFQQFMELAGSDPGGGARSEGPHLIVGWNQYAKQMTGYPECLLNHLPA